MSTEIWTTDIKWIKQADLVVAEVSNPRLGVGYEIAKAEEWGKRVLALYREAPRTKLSAMIYGAPGVEVRRYADLAEAYVAIDDFLERQVNRY